MPYWRIWLRFRADSTAGNSINRRIFLRFLPMLDSRSDGIYFWSLSSEKYWRSLPPPSTILRVYETILCPWQRVQYFYIIGFVRKFVAVAYIVAIEDITVILPIIGYYFANSCFEMSPTIHVPAKRSQNTISDGLSPTTFLIVLSIKSRSEYFDPM